MHRPFALPALACFAALQLASPAHADNILAGHDLYRIDPASTIQDFSGATTIPAGFFDPGSEPFSGVVFLVGGLIPSYPGCLGNPGFTDVVVRRPIDSNTPVVPSTDVIPIEIVALSLVSASPITVTYSGGPPEHWNIKVDLSPTPSGPGQKTIRHTVPSGGTFDSQLPVRPRFTFTRLSDSAVRVLDAGVPGFDSFFDIFVTLDVPWTHASDPAEVAQPSCKSNFTGSYDGDPVTSLWTGQHGHWGLKPAPPQRPVPVVAATWGLVKTIYR